MADKHELHFLLHDPTCLNRMADFNDCLAKDCTNREASKEYRKRAKELRTAARTIDPKIVYPITIIK